MAQIVQSLLDFENHFFHAPLFYLKTQTLEYAVNCISNCQLK